MFGVVEISALRKVIKNISLSFSLVRKDVDSLKIKVAQHQGAIEQLDNSHRLLIERISALEKGRTVVVRSAPAVSKVIVTRNKSHFIGAKSSMKVHDMNCPFAKNINSENRVILSSKARAFKLGYRACTCLK